MSLTFGRSSHASLYPMGRGVWLITNQASRTIFRVESRIAESFVQETAVQAIHAAARAQQRLLHGLNAPDSKANLIDVSDNIQATGSVYDQRFGRKSKVITGFWGTLVLAEDYEEGAFDTAPVKDAEDRLERKQLSVPLLLQSIDTQHLGNVSITVVTRSLIDFSSDLTAKLKDRFETSAASLLQRHQIPEDRHTKVFPLGSNSANEMMPQGMKQGVMDHISTQRGITEDNLNGRVLLHSGDGKTFDMGEEARTTTSLFRMDPPPWLSRAPTCHARLGEMRAVDAPPCASQSGCNKTAT